VYLQYINDQKQRWIYRKAYYSVEYFESYRPLLHHRYNVVINRRQERY